ncbi:unnamed protein product [Arctia plantaginis]|uniref:Peptidase S1 domain-containing protein n=1 Tax=Arctia plantaginis TaxID=874455 RepID=A0A8S0YLE1_ARCPL|nr:unnamed protein product [Arctia plantaginis]
MQRAKALVFNRILWKLGGINGNVKCERRIVNGEEIDKSYVVYIVWDTSNETLTEYLDSNTVCGGFILNEVMVVTSGACLKQFPYQYVIAGYNKYVPGAVGRNKKEEECMEIAKKPIIEKCYHYYPHLRLHHAWAYNDLAIARLETAYDFNNQAFTEKCSYQPTVANYKYRVLQPGTDVVVYGWGSNRYHKPENISFDINQDYLMATTTKVIALDECDQSYAHSISNDGRPRFCTDGESSLDIYGEPTGTRRANVTYTSRNRTQVYALDVLGVHRNKTIALRKSLYKTGRRHGPCQNDHGGPISTWERGEEIVVGIVTGYLVNRDMECVGPYIYSLLHYFHRFIACTQQKLNKQGAVRSDVPKPVSMYQSMTKALLVLLLARYAKCQRRIVNGEEINKSYVVYIVWDLSNKKLTEYHDTTTICGGFFITENLVITADECLKIYPTQYVIAGYNKYVPGALGRNKEEEECLKIAKKPIIEKHYFRTSQAQLKNGWHYEELAFARLETAFDFNDQAFTEKCSYQPSVANYQFRELKPGTDVVVYGWGSNRYHRPENILFDTNQSYLMATTTKVIALDECNKNYIHAINNIHNIRFRTEGESSLDVYGQPTDTRRANTNNTQNDHGGPIATWENGTEIVVGIVTGYLVNNDMECVAPYIYTELTFFKKFLNTSLQKFKT